MNRLKVLQKKIKFTHAKFEYFLLQINPNTELAEIESKLNGFKKLEHKNPNIVLSIAGDIQHIALEKTILGILTIANKLELNFHAVLSNNFIHVDRISGIQVINMPESEKASELVFNTALLYSDPLRSGMKLENDGDIIITSFVSDNAEVIALGNIHIYGEAKGRLVAGSNGDKTARIFVGKFNAELVSIGGLYRTMDEKLPDNISHKSVMISLDNKNRLIIEPMAY